MKVILTHSNADFDALASLIAASTLHPDYQIALPTRLTSEVAHFLEIYKDMFTSISTNDLVPNDVSHIILVDTHEMPHIEQYDHASFIIYDHHEPFTHDFATCYCEPVGATTTLLVEKIIEQHIEINPLLATVFALGIYSDTDSFRITSTTSRDMRIAAHLLEKGANLEVVSQFKEVALTEDQQDLTMKMMDNGNIYSIKGMDVFISQHNQSHYTGHLAHITKKMLQLTGADACINIVTMGSKTFVTCRSVSELIDFRPLLTPFNGGGHAQAAAATLKNEDAQKFYSHLMRNLQDTIVTGLLAKDIMSCPVNVVSPKASIETASKMLLRYGHSGFPVVEEERVVGVISRRDIDKAIHHDLGHAPVKGFMQRSPITIDKIKTLAEIKELMITNHIGRLPVIEDEKLIGIISRSDVIAAMHKLEPKKSLQPSVIKRQVAKTMQKKLSPLYFSILQSIGHVADTNKIDTFLIGGIVRDLFLDVQNEDIDIVVEGDGIAFAHSLKETYGGRVRFHEAFRTATWEHPEGVAIDITSARVEYYDFPAALPKVTLSSLREDMYRRDFTINTLAVSLNKNVFGELIDHFQGLADIRKKTLRVLYNLSFVEDPTRLLRAARFSARFSFTLDAQSAQLAQESKEMLKEVSGDRLHDELLKLVSELNIVKSADSLKFLHIDQELIGKLPDQSTLKQRERAFRRYVKILSLENELLDFGKILLLCSNSKLDHLLRFTMKRTEKKLLTNVKEWIDFMQSKRETLEIHEKGHKTQDLTLILASIMLNPNGSKLSSYTYLRKHTITFTGADLIAKGMNPGPSFKVILSYLKAYAIDHPTLSREELLVRATSPDLIKKNEQK
ncbi:CBS domain-containing protein [Paenalkalicoccus suaedae]|uniref:CBS domain-containing protein n=1 Tax=Paenalkalicoccus suaedae TaxID=2592382 RepID=A0A859FD21_9BACI|nr:CBS domain-containing protein [Paenalkalicoccus suaedae]QKS70820.1 CBS domain-containing protein [Paenalkalicoccus suaedae]